MMKIAVWLKHTRKRRKCPSTVNCRRLKSIGG